MPADAQCYREDFSSLPEENVRHASEAKNQKNAERFREKDVALRDTLPIKKQVIEALIKKLR